MPQVILIGTLKKISGISCLNHTDSQGHVAVEITTELTLECDKDSGGAREIVFYGILPSHLIGKKVRYSGIAVGGIPGRHIRQVFTILHGIGAFTGEFRDESNTRDLSEREGMLLLVKPVNC